MVNEIGIIETLSISKGNTLEDNLDFGDLLHRYAEDITQQTEQQVPKPMTNEEMMEVASKLAASIGDICSKYTYKFADDTNIIDMLHEYGKYITYAMCKGYITIEELPFLKVVLPGGSETFLLFNNPSKGVYSYKIDDKFVPPTIYTIDIVVN